MPNREQEVEECDARNDDSSIVAGNIKSDFFIQ
jgi:hypothetical protein